MDKSELEKFLCKDGDTLVDAMQKIDINAKGIVYVIDKNSCLYGSLSDGDIRRWILKTGSVDGTVWDAAYRDVKFLMQGESDHYIHFMKLNEISSVPVVNQNHQIKEIKFMDEHGASGTVKYSEVLSASSIVIMAGGKGTRLYPYTKILPKPLIPVGDVPILERILNKFYSCGARDFYLTLNYKKEMIKSYFKEVNLPYKIHFIEEEKPLGTAGSMRLIKKQFHTPVMITNCDILIEADYEAILKHHLSSGNDMTIVSSLKNIPIPYGVLEAKEHGIITSMYEKPQLSYIVNTGMYIVNPDYLDWIPVNRVFHMTDLAEKLMSQEKQVGMYPISENSFLDMGEFEEMKKMEERIHSGNVK